MRKHHAILLVTLLVSVSCASPKPAVSVKRSGSSVAQSRATDSKTTDRLQHTNAFATVSFKGLAALCINEEQQGEVAILKNQHHNLMVEVKKITPKGTSRISFPVDGEHNIRIEVLNPAIKGVRTYVNDAVKFDKETDQGDPEDFRWAIDLEGREFHDSKLAITTPALLRPVFTITDGVFYTQQRSVDMQGRVTWESDNPWLFVGKVADVIAADIYLKGKGGDVVLRSDAEGSEPLRLKRELGVRYEIAVSNERHHVTAMGGATDFRYWYDVFRDEAGRRYDLRRVEEYDFSSDAAPLPSASRRFLSYGPGRRARHLDSGMQVCNPTFLSRTRGFLK